MFHYLLNYMPSSVIMVKQDACLTKLTKFWKCAWALTVSLANCLLTHGYKSQAKRLNLFKGLFVTSWHSYIISCLTDKAKKMYIGIEIINFAETTYFSEILLSAFQVFLSQKYLNGKRYDSIDEVKNYIIASCKENIHSF